LPAPANSSALDQERNPRRDAPRAGGSAGAGARPTWIPLLIAAAFVIWVVDAMTVGVEAAGFEIVDPRSSRLTAASGFCDPRWRRDCAGRIATLPSLRSTTRLRSSASAPRSRRCRSWPAWAKHSPLARQHRRALASANAGGVRDAGHEYLPVAADGIFLPGRWPTPPWIETAPGVVGYLP
jgi:hypothetical protein